MPGPRPRNPGPPISDCPASRYAQRRAPHPRPALPPGTLTWQSEPQVQAAPGAHLAQVGRPPVASGEPGRTMSSPAFPCCCLCSVPQSFLLAELVVAWDAMPGLEKVCCAVVLGWAAAPAPATSASLTTHASLPHGRFAADAPQTRNHSFLTGPSQSNKHAMQKQRAPYKPGETSLVRLMRSIKVHMMMWVHDAQCRGSRVICTECPLQTLPTA